MASNDDDERPRVHHFSHGDQLDTEDLNWPAVYELTTQLVFELKESSFYPDRIVAIYDPENSGGYAVACQVAALIGTELKRSEPQLDLMRIEGRSGTRVVTEAPSIPDSAGRLLLIDDVAWSGNTMRIAKDKMRTLTSAQIRTGALLAGEPAIHDGSLDFWARRSNARDVRFPWGVVTPTAELAQFFELPTDGARHPVSWGPRPWGFWEQFALNQICTVRLLTIFPDQCLSLHSHKLRDEFFIALDDGIRLQVGDKTILANSGDYILIPRLRRHRQMAPATHTVRALEVSFGHYDQVKDIIRYEDKYGRVDMDGSV